MGVSVGPRVRAASILASTTATGEPVPAKRHRFAKCYVLDLAVQGYLSCRATLREGESKDWDVWADKRIRLEQTAKLQRRIEAFTSGARVEFITIRC